MSKISFVPTALAVALMFGSSGQAAETVLFEKQSPFADVVVTENDQGLRTLMFGRNGTLQSAVKVGDPDYIEFAYLPAMLAAVTPAQKLARALVVGLGGGSLPTFLQKHFPEMTVDVVDIDPVVVEVAKKYFGVHETDQLRLHVDDGRRFIENTKEPYDIVFLDAYNAENIPFHLATKEFLQAVRRVMTPGGIVIANIWDREANPLHDSMVCTYQEVFSGLYVLDIEGGGNEILMALPRQQPLKKADLVSQGSALSKQRSLRFDMGAVLGYGFHSQEKPAHCKVLADKKSI